MLFSKKAPVVCVMLLALMGCDDGPAAESSDALRADIAACIPPTVATLADARRVEQCLDRIPSAPVAPEEVYDLCFTTYSTCADTNGEALCSPILDECFGTVREPREDPERSLNACFAASDGCITGGVETARCLDGLAECLDSLDRRVPDLYEDTITELCLDAHTECLTDTGETFACERVRDACLDYVEEDEEDERVD